MTVTAPLSHRHGSACCPLTGDGLFDVPTSRSENVLCPSLPRALLPDASARRFAASELSGSHLERRAQCRESRDRAASTALALLSWAHGAIEFDDGSRRYRMTIGPRPAVARDKMRHFLLLQGCSRLDTSRGRGVSRPG